MSKTPHEGAAEHAPMAPSSDISCLIEIMAALRTPVTGCPWDLVQSFATIAPYTIEEAYEVADAIARGDMGDLCDELGDLLLQVVYHAQMAQEINAFRFGDVVLAVTSKMIRRHPHVFGSGQIGSQSDVSVNWERIKAEERLAKGKANKPLSALDGVPIALPALLRATKIQERAKRVGFDWPDVRQVMDKVREEINEVSAELEHPSAHLHEEIGDLLFAVVNLARHCGGDSEQILANANSKFERRFRAIEAALAEQGRSPEQASLDEMEALWQIVKTQQRR